MPNEDARIEAAIRQRLQTLPQLEAPAIHVAVESGIVTLGGRVRSGREKELAAEAAGEVKGVLGVDNQLRIVGPGEAIEHDLQGGGSPRPDGMPPLDRRGSAS